MIAELMRYKRYEPCALSERGAARAWRATAPRSSKRSTMLKNRTTAILDGLFSGSFRPAKRTLLEQCATPQQTHLSDRCTLECTLKEAFCSNCGQKKAEELKAATKASVAVGFGSKTLTFELRLFHKESELVCSQIDEVEFELTRLLDKASGRWLLSVPGI
ncbi:hypothetical protein [Atopobium sp. oral taxon 416]|uniref:hypothetical protein n=1 Tax=Atopobium sp. oral taxon 416 TaxID=712157 RepID=UPI001BA5BB3A|nr:hypothetical protein [Atopobium sp. oral taxon 416]QUC04363.1 hypothetical protein J4859_05380 [Atopobium sp. oral taxon 416]